MNFPTTQGIKTPPMISVHCHDLQQAMLGTFLTAIPFAMLSGITTPIDTCGVVCIQSSDPGKHGCHSGVGNCKRYANRHLCRELSLQVAGTGNHSGKIRHALSGFRKEFYNQIISTEGEII